MDLILQIVIIVVLLASILGAIYLLYRAVRLFITKRLWRGLGALLVSFLLGFMVFSVIIAIIGAREMSKRCLCSNHLMQIILFMKMHASDHDEAYPITFDGLTGDYVKPADTPVFICPSSDHQPVNLTNIHSWTDYAYVSGLTEADPAGCVVAFCQPENHNGEGANVTFIGGNVQWYSCEPIKDSTGNFQPTFQELTNTPSLFYGTTNEIKLAELMKRTRIIYPQKVKLP